MDSSLHLVPPGATSCPLLLGGSLKKDGPGWEKAENKFTATSGLPACVCVCVCVSCVASIYARVCSSVSCVPLKKPDKGLKKDRSRVSMLSSLHVFSVGQCVCVCVCVFACVTVRERERGRERECVFMTEYVCVCLCVLGKEKEGERADIKKNMSQA